MSICSLRCRLTCRIVAIICSTEKTLPFTYVRDDAKRRITATAEGPIATEDVVAFIEWQHAQGLWAYGVLCDLRGTKVLLSRTDLKGVVQTTKEQSERPADRGTIALVATDHETYLMACGYAALAGQANYEVQVFRSFEDAEEWLDLHVK
jgi:hypothetical protein